MQIYKTHTSVVNQNIIQRQKSALVSRCFEKLLLIAIKCDSLIVIEECNDREEVVRPIFIAKDNTGIILQNSS